MLAKIQPLTTTAKKMFKIGGESFSEDTEQRLQEIEKHCLFFLKVVVVITVYLLIFGESRYIEGEVPLIWRIKYEWTHLLNDVWWHITHHVESEGQWYSR